MSHRFKILHIISSWASGVGDELAEFSRRLANKHDDGLNFDQKICVLADSASKQTLHVPTNTLGLRWPYDPGTYLGVDRMIRQFRPDVVHTWDNTAQRYGVPHFGKQHIVAEKRPASADTRTQRPYIGFADIDRKINSKTSRFIVPRSPYDCPDDCTKTIVIPPSAIPCSPQGGQAKPMSAEELLTKLNIPTAETLGEYYPVYQSQYEPERRSYRPTPTHTSPFLIGIVLPLGAEHRTLDALWVCETLNHVHLNFHAFFIGDASRQRSDGVAQREEILRYRDRWKLFSRTHFLGNSPESRRLLPNFDILLHLSSSSEYSGVILSAMSYGVPVIAVQTLESREYISDGITGILIPDGDYRFYRRTAAKRLLYLLENEELRHSMAFAAMEKVDRDYKFETAFQRRVNVYRDIGI